MSIRRIGILVVLAAFVTGLVISRSHRPAQAQEQAPVTIYNLTNVTGEQLRKAVEANPATITDRNPEGRTLLSLIFSYRKPSVEDVRTLLKAGADARSEDYRGTTVLHCAAASGDPKVIAVLVEAGADLNKRDQNGRTPLRSAVWGRNKDNAETLIKLGATIDLFSAAALGKASEVESIMYHDHDAINEEDGSHYTPIEWAAMRKQKEVLKVMARFGPKVNIFRSAALGDERAVSDALHTTPGLINATDIHDLSALDWAVRADDPEMVKYLLDHGATAGQSHALVMAAATGDVELVKMLLEHGAGASDPDGSAYWTAIRAQHPELAELIKQAKK